jgi:hypothetical protein
MLPERNKQMKIITLNVVEYLLITCFACAISLIIGMNIQRRIDINLVSENQFNVIATTNVTYSLK